MRNSKRFLTIVLAVLMVMSAFAFNASAATSQFTDVSADNETLTKAVNLLSYIGVAKGTSETTFGTEDLVTREQMAAFIYRLMKAGKSVEGGTNTTSFTDLEDPTFFYMISWADSQGVIKGRSQTIFDPKGNITLQDAYTMIVRALGYEDEETLPYPFGYIDIAEQKGVELDEGLPSTISYDDSLTRGDVAVILYNAFFAQLAKGETSYKVVEDEKGNQTMTPTTTYYTVAEKVFDVTKKELKVTATPHFFLDGESDAATSEDFDVDMLQFQSTEDSNNSFSDYYKFEDLGLEGKADDYILASFTVFYTEDEDGKFDNILYAEPLMNQKTVNSATFGTLSTTTQDSYWNNDITKGKKLNGQITIDGQKGYFYDAPYSYATPAENTYKARNAKNINLIDYELMDEDKGIYKITNVTPNFFNDDMTGTYDEGDPQDNAATRLARSMYLVYTKGYFELDVIDSNNDGMIDYIWYKPYTFGKLVEDKDHRTIDEHVNAAQLGAREVDNGPVIYTYGATVEGVEAKDEDMVIAYVNGAINYVKVAAVVKGVEGTIDSARPLNWVFTLDNGTSVDLHGTSALLNNFYNDKDNISSELPVWDYVRSTYSDLNGQIGEEGTFYIYNGKLMYKDGVSSSKFDLSDSILIPVKAETKAAGSLQNGKLKFVPYLEVFVDGEVVSVPVETDGLEPEVKGSEGEYDFSEYQNQICSYTVDSKGVYTLTKLIGTRVVGDDADVLKGKKENEQYGKNVGAGVDSTFEKVTGNRYTFGNSSVLPYGVRYVSLTDYSQIIIKSVNDEGKDVYTLYDLTSMPNFENVLNNIQYILVNNPSSTVNEYLAVLYGETDSELDHASVAGQNDDVRILKTYEINVDSNGDYHYYYSVYNPFTGKVENNIPGVVSSSKKLSNLDDKIFAGVFAKVVDGQVQDKKLVNEPETPVVIKNEVKELLEYDPISGLLEIKGEDRMIRVTKDTTVTLLNASGDDIKWGNIALKTPDTLNDSSNSLRYYWDRQVNPNTGKYETIYADNMRIYYATTKSSDTANGEEIYDADFIVIYVERNETIAKQDQANK